jgi:NAD(P)H-hydrate epimerase
MVTMVERLPRLPQRRRDAHKGDFGRVLIVGGSPGMTGAPCMAAVAAQKAGAGLVTVGLPESLGLVAAIKLTSAMSRWLPEEQGGVLGEAAAQRVLEWSGEFDVVAIGPGARLAPGTVSAMRHLTEELHCPVVVDADALNALAGATDILRRAQGLRILTPHPGEMARLLGAGSPAEVQNDRMELAVQFARRCGVIVALKGAGTVVTDGERAYVNPSGNPGMATGGTGDVLTGLVAGLLCQGLEPYEAVQLAVFVHGLAGDLAARAVGELSTTAEDVLDRTARAFCIVNETEPDAAPAALAAAVREGRLS